MNINNEFDSLDLLVKKLAIQTPEERIKVLRQKTFYHITIGKHVKRCKKNESE